MPCTTEDMHHWRSQVSKDCSSIDPCLLITAVQQPETSSPSFQLKRSSEGIIWENEVSTERRLLLIEVSSIAEVAAVRYQSTVIWENEATTGRIETAILNHGRGKELLKKKTVHIQMTPSEERFN